VPPPPQPAAIRRATEEDLDRVVDLLWAVAAEGRWIGTEIPFDRPTRRAAFAGRLAGPDSVVLVADAGPGAGVVGHLQVVVAPYGVADLGMLLAEGWRGFGLGSALLDAGLEWAEGAGAHKAALQVWPHNEAGLALYRSRGFVEEGRLVRHYRRRDGQLWGAVIMGRRLDETAERAERPASSRSGSEPNHG
jgi:ribosomal protein S18 acetylase RimI-like enzyme